jgi:hypothetical protein
MTVPPLLSSLYAALEMASAVKPSSPWPLLNVRQRQFLLVASEVETAKSPFDVGTLPWRKVGAMCGLDSDESDEMVQSLSALALVQVVDAEKQTMVLGSGRSLVQQVMEGRTMEMGQWLHASPAN